MCTKAQMMEEQANTTAKGRNKEFWRKCPICIRNNAVSPDFQEFLPLIKHMEEHLQPEPRPVRRASRYITEMDLLAFHYGFELRETPRRKIAREAEGLLVLVSQWLQAALVTCPEINTITTSNLKVADQLMDLVRKLPDEFAEQRAYLLQREERLRDTGMDPKWLRRPGRQVGFVADSMAGAGWDLPPATSREYIRRNSPRKKSIDSGLAASTGLTDELIKEGTWWKPEDPNES